MPKNQQLRFCAHSRPHSSSPIPSAARITSDENSSDSSKPAPSAIKIEPSNSFFLHIKTAPDTAYVSGAAFIPVISVPTA